MAGLKQNVFVFGLRYASVILFAVVFLIFGSMQPKFLEINNLVNILIQSSSIAIVAAGMTFVLLTAGIDLSVGSIMFLSAAISGKMILAGYPLSLALAVILIVGLAFGLLNALFVGALKIMPFVATLATLFIGRGLSLMLTETRAMNLPDSLLRIGSARLYGVPFPVIILIAVAAIGHLVLTRTGYGRRIYAVGNDLTAARKAGLKTNRLIASVYLISALCAALGGLVSVAQLGAVSPTFGYQREFVAVAAAVLGGTSLFGGRGDIFPGTIFGAVLIQTVENGLVIVNADPYAYPLVVSALIFFAVLIDSLRHAQIKKLARRKIRVETAT